MIDLGELNPTKAHILLASNSPRRRELLGMISSNFSIPEMHEVDEKYPADMETADVPEFLSKLKSDAYLPLLNPGQILLTADTGVIVPKAPKSIMLGKPKDEDNAVEMLMELSGREHLVVTGVTLASAAKTISFSETTKVLFAELDPKRARLYAQMFRPFDKAGAYGIQEWIGAASIRRIDGSFYNVMGLPVHQVYRRLLDFPY
ncbi:MAG: Maf family nucleotide pyrophosphatase [Lachnospiraceae bacterium]|nr:Maf family nucleotide pyrophosphatase [Lachnospiraceae bacterium]